MIRNLYQPGKNDLRHDRIWRSGLRVVAACRKKSDEAVAFFLLSCVQELNLKSSTQSTFPKGTWQAIPAVRTGPSIICELLRTGQSTHR
jgi:hypothetical protein